MGEWYLVVADDRVVEIRDPQRAVGAQLDLDGTEGGVVAGEEIRLAGGVRRGAAPVEARAIDATRDGIAVEEIVVELAGEMSCRVVREAGDRARAVVVGRDRRREPDRVGGRRVRWRW